MRIRGFGGWTISKQLITANSLVEQRKVNNSYVSVTELTVTNAFHHVCVYVLEVREVKHVLAIAHICLCITVHDNNAKWLRQ